MSRIPTAVADPVAYIRDRIRTVPDWPEPGVMFRDITPLLADPKVFRVLIDQFVHRYFDVRPDLVAGLDARGFIIGAVLAFELGVGFVPIRKKGKLPFTTVAETYELEYGSATVEMHTDAVRAGDRVLLIDDLIATGGTMMAGKRLLERLGATVVEGAAIVDLPELGGSAKLREAGCRCSRWRTSRAIEGPAPLQLTAWPASMLARMRTPITAAAARTSSSVNAGLRTASSS